MSANRLKLNMDKTELLWAGTRRFLSMGNGSFPSLQLGEAIIAPSQHVRVFGVIFFADLSLGKHVSNVSATCFHHLRQLYTAYIYTAHPALTDFGVCHDARARLRDVPRRRVDYCNVVFVGAPPTSCNEC